MCSKFDIMKQFCCKWLQESFSQIKDEMILLENGKQPISQSCYIFEGFRIAKEFSPKRNFGQQDVWE